MQKEKLIKYIFIGVAVILLLLAGYLLGNRGKEQTMNQFKREQARELKQIRAKNDSLESSNDLLNKLNNAAIEREKERLSEIAILSKAKREDSVNHLNQVRKFLNGLNSASNEEISLVMDSTYRAEALEGDFLTPLEPDPVTINKPVALFYIEINEQRKHWKKKYLLSERLNLARIGLINNLNEQKDIWEQNKINYLGIIEQKDLEIASFQDGQKFMEGKARKFRRQRNAFVVGGVVVVGSLGYLLLIR